MRSAAIPRNLFLVNVITIVMVTVRPVTPSRSRRPSVTIGFTANLNLMDGIGDHRKDDARRAEIVRY
jgi:hypothetical protein